MPAQDQVPEFRDEPRGTLPKGQAAPCPYFSASCDEDSVKVPVNTAFQPILYSAAPQDPVVKHARSDGEAGTLTPVSSGFDLVVLAVEGLSEFIQYEGLTEIRRERITAYLRNRMPYLSLSLPDGTKRSLGPLVGNLKFKPKKRRWGWQVFRWNLGVMAIEYLYNPMRPRGRKHALRIQVNLPRLVTFLTLGPQRPLRGDNFIPEEAWGRFSSLPYHDGDLLEAIESILQKLLPGFIHHLGVERRQIPRPIRLRLERKPEVYIDLPITDGKERRVRDLVTTVLGVSAQGDSPNLMKGGGVAYILPGGVRVKIYEKSGGQRLRLELQATLSRRARLAQAPLLASLALAQAYRETSLNQLWAIVEESIEGALSPDQITALSSFPEEHPLLPPMRAGCRLLLADTKRKGLRDLGRVGLLRKNPGARTGWSLDHRAQCYFLASSRTG